MEYSLSAFKNTFENNLDNSFPGTRRESSATVRCRICLDSTVNEELIAPCYCTGTIGLLHKNCLEKWLNLSKSHICEICGYEFKVSYTSPTLIEVSGCIMVHILVCGKCKIFLFA
ncbi:hypothetical protein P879_10812 [Paragonimus westermani]|uniref:RING-CH-type domain-containing protein n=1 Tax=Paragonimus westermani TaxID=34504 RepID=A0A8T0DI05_9TREM|nr:hypothetical protein P879_10812 [Paragonimus westermani]